MKKRNVPLNNQTITLTSIIVALACFGLLATKAFGVTPPPDGCYPNLTTAGGCNALSHLSDGAANTGLGWSALFGTSTGGFNTAIGAGALVLNNEDSNTAVGAAALLFNTAGTSNSALGTGALTNNDNGNDNTGLGAFALYNNTEGNSNSAVGFNALYSHTGPPPVNPTGAAGGYNNAFGSNALYSDETGSQNNAFGGNALFTNVSGIANTAVGDMALSNSTGDYNIALGANAGTDPGITSNNVYIGDPGFPGDVNVLSIGGIAASGTDYQSTFIGGIYGASVNQGSALAVYVDTDGHLGTMLVNASGKKVRIRSYQGANPQAKVDEFQKQQKRIAELENTVARLVATVQDQAAQIEKVNAKLELQKPAQRVVANKQ
jgi:hypothetical protein